MGETADNRAPVDREESTNLGITEGSVALLLFFAIVVALLLATQ